MRAIILLASVACAMASAPVWVAPAHKDPNWYNVEGARSAHLSEFQRIASERLSALRDANARNPNWDQDHSWRAPAPAPVVVAKVAPAAGWSAPAQGWTAPAQGWTAPAQGWTAPAQGWSAPAAPAQGWSAPNWNNAGWSGNWAAPAPVQDNADVAAARQAHLAEVARQSAAAIQAANAAAARDAAHGHHHGHHDGHDGHHHGHQQKWW